MHGLWMLLQSLAAEKSPFVLGVQSLISAMVAITIALKWNDAPVSMALRTKADMFYQP